MKENTVHEVHVPVMGTAFSVDAPIKVARYGISSVISMGDDELLEYMRKYYCEQGYDIYVPINRWDDDYRARRITAYLNLVSKIVQEQFRKLKSSPFEPGSEITKYFEMLPDHSPLRKEYDEMLETADGTRRKALQEILRSRVQCGHIDVNIMTKVDRNLYGKDGRVLPDEFSDGLAGLRGYARSNLDNSSIVFSAGFNRRLYSYLEKFDDFFPDENGYVKKRVILKVSDYRSSMTQGKFLAKKGVWVFEHRIESGLNCGGHVFATEGLILGPILEEFKAHKQEMLRSLLGICNETLIKRGRKPYHQIPYTRVTVQGGIGTAKEQRYLMDYYQVDGTGWATPFLLVPEVTNVDASTRDLLRNATEKDLYVSEVSPLGIPFNTIRNTASEQQRLQRIAIGKPGSPCPKGHLVSNTEFTEKPICRASSAYQNLKIAQLKNRGLDPQTFQEEYDKVVLRTCLCEDLAAPVLVDKGMDNHRPLKPAICPGPNLAYFSRFATLHEMVDHIYGRINLLNETYRPNMFVKELGMYVDYLKREIRRFRENAVGVTIAYIQSYKNNLLDGIRYYKTLIPKMVHESQEYRENMARDLLEQEGRLFEVIGQHQDIFMARLREPAMAAEG